ncbi:MAG: excinuclease ABC subunit UvrA [Chloroflexi bacterium]|nr:excinuclease ABC subunit UvrA [Chloroflexota bacterium]
MAQDKIVIKGAREHNLKNIDIELPRDQLVVLTGVSGSGKSSLAFDTLYAEGQRRYVESLSSYARQFLGQLEKPKVDFIGGLSPAIAIEQKSASKNPRSTVGTVTEIYDYLRVLFARIGVPHCHKCGKAIGSQTAEQMVNRVLELPKGTRFMLLAPMVAARKGEYKDIFDDARSQGFSRARVDGEIRDLQDDIKLNKKVKHTIDIVVDRLVVPTDDDETFRSRLNDSVETALRTANGTIIIAIPEFAQQTEKSKSKKAKAKAVAAEVNEEELLPEEESSISGMNAAGDIVMSEDYACVDCGISFLELNPQMFSFNAPQGACPECAGLGTRLEVDAELLVPNPNLSLHDGAVTYWGELRKKVGSWGYRALQAIAAHYQFDLDTPWKDLSPQVREILMQGSGSEKVKHVWSEGQSKGEYYRRWEGLGAEIMRRFQQTGVENMREHYQQWMSDQPCHACHGAKLRPESLAVTVGDENVQQICAKTVAQGYAWACGLTGSDAHWVSRDGLDTTVLPLLSAAPTPTKLDGRQLEIAGEVLKEIRERLGFLLNVGLHYLTLDRSAPSLSGGEAQRIRLASQIGAGLMGVMYILDEPSIGLHQRDNRKLIDTLTKLRDLGNTVIVVEHDEDTMKAADWLVDFGPGAGVNGGKVVAEGRPEYISSNGSLTGSYLSGRLKIEVPPTRRPAHGHITLHGATHNNLNNLDITIPLGTLVAVTGVSGSGKSSLITETLYPALANLLNRAQLRVGKYDTLEGLEQLDKVIDIDQQPIGRTPRSNPATYVKLFDQIREVFANTPDAKLRGYEPGRFSFNVKGGRCEACQGNGEQKIEMHFLADVWVRCDECKGKRYNRETLQVRYKGKTISDVLDMDVHTALEFFENHPKLKRVLQTLHDVGLDYIKLGQSATTLSGGEAQRVKLAKELARVATGRTIYILDEPTTGLHFADVQNLLRVIQRLVKAGNTVLVIEHSLDVIKTADWIIDLGPEGGTGGGYIIAQGTPEEVALHPTSHTAVFLRDLLNLG